FREQLLRWVALHQSLAGTTGDRRAAVLQRYHREASRETTAEWTRLRVAAGIPKLAPVRRVSSPTAQEAAARANSKMFVEAPVLARLDLGGSLRTLRPDEWARLGALEAATVELSPAAVALINRKQPATDELLGTLRTTVAIDTIYNEAELHRQIHDWYARNEITTLNDLDARVYAELF